MCKKGKNGMMYEPTILNFKILEEMEKGWDFYYEEGKRFYLTAHNSYKGKGKSFNNELLFNIISMSMERLLVSLLLYNNKMPLSETVSGLIRELGDIVSWPEELRKKVRLLNRFVYLCSLEPTPMKIPNNEEMVEIMDIARELKELVAIEIEEFATKN